MLTNKKSFAIFRLLTDLILLNISFLLAAVWAQSWDVFLSKQTFMLLIPLENLIWVLSSNISRELVENEIRMLTYGVADLIKKTGLQLFTAVFFIFAIKENLFTRNFILYYALLLFITILIKQYIFILINKQQLKKGKSARKVLIAGSGELAQNFRMFIDEHSDFGLKFSGFITGINGGTKDKAGDLENFEKVLTEKQPDIVVIALELNDYEKTDRLLRLCDKYAVNAFIIPDYLKFISNKFQINLLGDFPVISVRQNPLEETINRALKRIFDLSVSLVVFILILWWLIPLISFFIKRDSKGNSFFIQKRYGINNKLFNCYKFRTMRPESETTFKAVEDGDDRVTGIGRFLRKTNLDELPQILNVLKGEMSLVGPRPHATGYHDTYKEIVEEIRLRHRVKPGITGWAQIHGLRGDVFDMEENKIRTKKRIEYDIWYVENWSFLLDIQILITTAWQMIRGKNLGR